jgi:glycosyltransferase involved in cell wall biosynthesis
MSAAVSVVIPAFNSANVIRSAIESALRQTHPPLEVIVVDDASSDSTVEIATSYPDERVRVERAPANLGGAAARNRGIDAARGEFVALLDSDDLWLPRKLEIQMDLISKALRPERTVCYTNVTVVQGTSRHTHNTRLYDPSTDLSEYLFVAGQMMQTSTLLLPTTFAREIRFDERLKRHQDWDFVLRANEMGADFLGTDQSLAEYIKAGSSSVSDGKSAEPSVFWYELAKPWMTSRARAYFYLAIVFPRLVSEHPVEAIWTMIRSCGPGRAPVSKAARVLGRRMLGPRRTGG